MTDVVPTLPEEAFDALKRECEPYTLADPAAVEAWLRENTTFDFPPDQLEQMRDRLLQSARAVGHIAHVLLELDPHGPQTGKIDLTQVQDAFAAVKKHCMAGVSEKLIQILGKGCSG